MIGIYKSATQHPVHIFAIKSLKLTMTSQSVQLGQKVVRVPLSPPGGGLLHRGEAVPVGRFQPGGARVDVDGAEVARQVAP